MSESREANYLRRVLALDPQSDAAEMLRLRRDYLQPSDTQTVCGWKGERKGCWKVGRFSESRKRERST